MNHDLIARYIYAVTRYLPLKGREDVEQELDSLISDMLSARCGDILPTEQDVRVVLTELGPPEELAAKYIGDDNKSLIGGIYFLIYKRILRLVLPIAAVGIALASVLSLFFEWESITNPYMFAGKLIGQSIGGAVGGTFQAFAVITIVFAILEQKKVTLSEGDLFSKLPPVPQKNAQIKPYEPAINMVWSVLAAIFFIGFPQLAGAWLEGIGWIPVFTTSVIRGYWLPIILWAILGITKETVKLIEGHYSHRVAVVTLAVNIPILISAAVVFWNGNIMNPDFVRHIGGLLAGAGGEAISGLFVYFNRFFLGIICFALLLETSVTAFKAWSARKHS